MAAPAEIIEHGAPQAFLPFTPDEPATTPTVKVATLSRKGSRDRNETKNINGVTVFVIEAHPVHTLSYTGQINATTGLGIAHPGGAVASLANFAATWRGFDPTAGIMILSDTEDTIENLNRAPATSFTVTQFPWVV